MELQWEAGWNAREVLSALPETIESLAIWAAFALTDADVALLSRLASLRRLTLWNCPELTRDALDALAKLPLEELELITCLPIDDDAARSIARFRSLRALDVSQTQDLSDAGVSVLLQLPLERLSIRDCASLTDDTLQALARSETLSALELTRSERFTEAGVRALASIRTLRDLVLLDVANVTEAALDPFAALPLMRVELRSPRLTRASEARLRKRLSGRVTVFDAT